MVFSFRCLFLVLFFFGFSLSERGPTGSRTLVILDDENIKSTHSIYFKYLEERGYSLKYLTAEEKAELQTFGEWNYDNLIIFAPTAQDISGIEPEEISEFIDAGGSAIITANSDIGDPIKSLASDCNIEFDESGTWAIDHLKHDVSDSGFHNLLALETVPDIPIIFQKKPSAPILFSGIAQDIEEDSPLLISLLHGYTSTYSHSLEGQIKNLHVSGKKTSLVTALQARNNARVIFSGSLDLFSDNFFTSSVQQKGGKKFEKSGNEDFAKSITTWAFKERGILRAKNVVHHRVGEQSIATLYTIKEDIEYSVEIEEWNGKQWVPFNADDVQLEFSMIDPYIRTTLKNDGKGKYSTQFKLPDVYGVFTFRLDYTRKGYGFLTNIERVPVRPFRHNQYERFIEAAYPYYASSFSMMIGLFIVSWFFLYHRDRNENK